MNLKPIEHQIKAIKKQLVEMGLMHPGSLSEQFNVCGNPTCRCKDPKDPQRHGPYHQLSYTWRGKSSTRFVRQESVAKMREKIANYKRLQELVKEWVDLSMELERQERAAQQKH
jgi:hypothetical protein